MGKSTTNGPSIPWQTVKFPLLGKVLRSPRSHGMKALLHATFIPLYSRQLITFVCDPVGPSLGGPTILWWGEICLGP